MNQKLKSSIKPVLLGLLLLAAPASLLAQYDYTTNADGISLTITGYNGPGGALTIPTNINGLTVTNIGETAFSGDTNLTSVTIPVSVTNIGQGAFSGCVQLADVTIPGSVTSIGADAFNSDSLTNVTISAGVTSLGEEVFANCICLTSVSIPISVTSLGYLAFINCTRLTNVSLPGDVNFYGAFSYTPNLTSVAIDNGVTNVEAYEFDEFNKLNSITFPASVTSIGEYACAYTDVTNVTIPASVTNLGAYAFYGISSLKSIFFAGNPPAFGSPLINGDQKTVYYLPGASGWSNTFAGVPAVLWNPQIQTSGASFGVQSNQFGFNITGNTNIPIVVEACTNLANPVWTPLQSLTLTNGSFYFSEPLQTNSPGRYYRISSP